MGLVPYLGIVCFTDKCTFLRSAYITLEFYTMVYDSLNLTPVPSLEIDICTYIIGAFGAPQSGT